MNQHQADTLALETFVVILEGILEGDAPPDINCGICDIMSYCGFSYTLVDRIVLFMTEWDYYSGNYNFPVPVPLEADVINPIHMYFSSAADGGSMWVGQYGALRKHLCAYLIERIEDELL